MKEGEPRSSIKREPGSHGPELPRPRFKLGQLVSTPGALQALEEAEQNPLELLFRHATGDWGDLGEEDRAENELSIEQGYRILSAYKLNNGVRI